MSRKIVLGSQAFMMEVGKLKKQSVGLAEKSAQHWSILLPLKTERSRSPNDVKYQ